jgi:hypothetical protein
MTGESSIQITDHGHAQSFSLHEILDEEATVLYSLTWAYLSLIHALKCVNMQILILEASVLK